MRKLRENLWIAKLLPRRDQTEVFRSIVEAAPNAMILVERDGSIVMVNAQAERMFGYGREEMVGRPVEMLVPERFRSRHPGFRGSFFAHPSTRSMGVGRDLYGLRRDGREVPVEIGLNPVDTGTGTMVLASVIDISERKRSEERFRQVVEAAPNAIILVERGGAIVMVNAQAERMFGYSREEMVGQSVEMLVPERFRGKHPGFRGNFFVHPGPRAMGAGRDLYGLRRDGREVPVEIGLSPVDTDGGMMVLASIIDISERKRAEARIGSLVQETQATMAVLGASTGDILAVTGQVATGSSETEVAINQTIAMVEEVKQTAHVAAEKAKLVSEGALRTAEIARNGKKSVDASVDVMRQIQEQMSGIAEAIVRLSEQGQAIADIIATVNELAEQSNLLAVNAAIEAAKAGEHGKGFAVVAQEVKSLAAQSKQATSQVRGILGEIQRASSGAALATEHANRVVESGVKLSMASGESIGQLADSIAEAAGAATQIAVSAQQQLVGMDQAVQAIQSIKEASTRNVVSTRQAESVAQQLQSLGSKLKGLMEAYQE